jgi:hypothetical protein
VLEVHKVDNFKDLDDNYTRTTIFQANSVSKLCSEALFISRGFEIASQNADDAQDVAQFTNRAKWASEWAGFLISRTSKITHLEKRSQQKC